MTVAVPTYFGIVVPCTAQLLRMSRAACVRRSTSPPTAPGITAHPKPLPSPAWPPSGGQAGEPHARSFGINKPWIEMPSN